MEAKTETVSLLKKLLIRAVLIKGDRELAQEIIDKLDHSHWDRESKKAAAALRLLLDQDEAIRVLISKRLEAKPVDIQENVFNGFSFAEIKNMVHECHSVQLTNGCTVGCPWCCFASNPNVSQRFSFVSLKKFFYRFRKYFPTYLMLYFSSDPFDWYDGENSYLDLVKYLNSIAKFSVGTSTAVPKGTEFTVLRYLVWLKGLRFCRSMSGLKGSHLEPKKISLLSSEMANLLLAQDLKKGGLMEKLRFLVNGDRGHYRIFRFSETRRNVRIIDAIYDLLVFVGFTKADFTYIEVEDRDTEERVKPIKMGRCFHDKDRDQIKDAVGPQCYDEVMIEPGTVSSLYATGVSTKYPEGIIKTPLEPGTQVIPKSVYIFDYLHQIHGVFKLIPYSRSRTFSKGKLGQTKTDYSVSRDILAYALVLERMLPAIGGQRKLFLKTLWSKQLERLKKEVNLRIKTTRLLLKKEKEMEVAAVAEKCIERLNKEFLNDNPGQ
jgi:hypothetical protein